MYQENEKFVNYVTNLDYTTKSYNKIRSTILDVEKPLVEKQLEEIDHKLKRAEKDLSWSTPGNIPNHLYFLSINQRELYIHIELLIVESKFYKGLFLCMIIMMFVSSCLCFFIHGEKNKLFSEFVTCLFSSFVIINSFDSVFFRNLGLYQRNSS